MAILSFDPIAQRDLSGGMVSHASDALLPPNTAKQAINFHFDVLGKATQRYGTTLLGLQAASAGQTCAGLFQFINSSGSINRLLAVFNTTVYSYNGSTWSTIAPAVTSTAKVRMASFLNLVFRVGGGSATASWNGTGSWGTSNLTSAPDGKFVISYKERLYIAGDASYPDRLFFSSIASSTSAITWSQSTQYLDVNPEDGNNITGLAKISDLLLIFKERSMYRWNGTQTDAEIIIDMGTSSQESIAQAKGALFFFNPTGIYKTNGGYPEEVSRPVWDWIKNMSASFYDDVSGLCDEDHYYCHIGDVTKDGRTYTNVVLVYTISSKNWSVYVMGGSFRFMAKYITTASAVTYVGGDTDGNVQTLFSGTTDNGSAIVYEYETKEFEFGSRGTTKSLRDFYLYMSNGTGALVNFSEDGRKFEAVGQATGEITRLKSLDMRFHYLVLKISGSNKSTPVECLGYEFVEMNSLGYID